MMNDMYWGKMMYASNKMKKNSEVETLTEEQHEVLAELCSIRHEFHCLDTMKVFSAEIDTGIDDWFYSEREGNIYEKLEEVGLPPLPHLNVEELPCNFDWECLGDEEKVVWEKKAEQEGKGNTGYDLWVQESEVLDKLSETLEDYNTVIEKYLRDIDNEHGTDYCPTGATRLF